MPWDPFTYRGALSILGASDPEALKRLDLTLGGVILAAGAAANIPALGVLAPVFGWVDQKDQALRIARSLVNGSAGQVMRTSGPNRLQLVVAAHSAIVGAAFFENFFEYVQLLKNELALTPDDKLRQLSTASFKEDKPIIQALYEVGVPMPSATRGFHENLPHVRAHYVAMVNRTVAFVEGLQAWSQPGLWQRRRKIDTEEFADEALERYRILFQTIASTIPEFLIWSTLGEHGATRTALRDLRDDLLELGRSESTALRRMEYLLLKMLQREGDEGDEGDSAPARLHYTREVLHCVNALVLEEPIVRTDSLRHVEGVTFPAIQQIYINPAFRFSQYGEGDRPADDRWWDDKEPHADIDVFLAGHLMSRVSIDRPTLILGHPGSGKSVLTKVIAARLPPELYTVVRVSLRSVDSAAPLFEQIRQALKNSTNGRVDWSELAKHSTDTINVILLDGFDELLQASGESQANYLQTVAEFQRTEAKVGRPVAVFVTTRTVVAERSRIPDGSLVIRLEPFSEKDVRAWLDVWNEVNHVRVAGEWIYEVDLAAALDYPELAAQPLLLLMLALYMSDPDAGPTDVKVSTTTLYQRLLENFTRREIQRSKNLPTLEPERVAELVRKRLWELSVVAFAMFNRGSQYVTDEQLGSDLSSMVPANKAAAGGEVRRSTVAQRVIRGFFFVHTSEIDLHHEDAKRSYEFLHATFGEFLLVISLLGMVTESVSGSVEQPDEVEVRDAKLFALLSHQTLALRRSTLGFVSEIFSAAPAIERRRVILTLQILLDTAFSREFSPRFADYRPLPTNHVRALAAYSANLVLLILTFTGLEGKSIRVRDLCPPHQADSERWWTAMILLWRSGLDDANTIAISETLTRFAHSDVVGIDGQRSTSIASSDLGNLLKE